MTTYNVTLSLGIVKRVAAQNAKDAVEQVLSSGYRKVVAVKPAYQHRVPRQIAENLEADNYALELAF